MVKRLYNFSSFIARSTDGGKTFKHVWTFNPVIDGKRIRGDEGLVEPDMAMLPNGEILCIMRRQSDNPIPIPVEGWREDVETAGSGWMARRKPKLRVLKNGVLACLSDEAFTVVPK